MLATGVQYACNMHATCAAYVQHACNADETCMLKLDGIIHREPHGTYMRHAHNIYAAYTQQVNHLRPCMQHKYNMNRTCQKIMQCTCDTHARNMQHTCIHATYMQHTCNIHATYYVVYATSVQLRCDMQHKWQPQIKKRNMLLQCTRYDAVAYTDTMGANPIVTDTAYMRVKHQSERVPPVWQLAELQSCDIRRQRWHKPEMVRPYPQPAVTKE